MDDETWIDVSTVGSPWEVEMRLEDGATRYRPRRAGGEPQEEWRPGLPPANGEW